MTIVRGAFSIVTAESAGGGGGAVEEGLAGVLRGLFSMRIGLARREAFYSATCRLAGPSIGVP